MTRWANFVRYLERLVVEFGYAGVFDRPGLTRPERQIATLSALAALGTAVKQRRFHIGGALNVGCTPEQIVEVFLQVSIYAGFPATLNAISVAREIFSERGHDVITKRHRTVASERFETGAELLEKIDGAGGTAVIEPLKDIAPDLGRFIVEYSLYAGFPAALNALSILRDVVSK